MVRGPASLVHQSPFSPLAHVQRKKGEDEFTSPVCSDEQTAVVCPVGGGRRDACPTLDNFVAFVASRENANTTLEYQEDTIFMLGGERSS